MQEELGPTGEDIEQYLPQNEVISSPELADNKLAGMWSGQIDIERLKSQFKSRAEKQIIETAQEDPFLGSVTSPTGNVEVEPFDRIILATSSPIKQTIAAEVAEETGVNIQPTLQTEITTENKLKEFLVGAQTGPEIKAIDIAELKPPELPDQKAPVLSMDTIVISSYNRVLEKPEDQEQAADMLRSMSGQNIRIVTALVMQYNLPSGKRLTLREGVEIGLKLRRLPDEEIKEYCETQKDRMLKIAGAIDFASNEGRNLIDDTEEIVVKSVQLPGISGITPQNLRLSVSAIQALDTYFRGAPKHPIRFLIEELKQISEGFNW
ncbi:MAG: Maf family protein [Candidatus Woykebacteria bacterium]